MPAFQALNPQYNHYSPLMILSALRHSPSLGGRGAAIEAFNGSPLRLCEQPSLLLRNTRMINPRERELPQPRRGCMFIAQS